MGLDDVRRECECRRVRRSKREVVGMRDVIGRGVRIGGEGWS